MEAKVKKLLVVSGVIASAAVALVPMTSYASYKELTATPPSTAGSTKVSVNINDYISLDAASAGDTILVSSNEVGTGKISASVSSTRDYTISLKAKTNPSLVNTDQTYSISAGSNVQAGRTAWGIKKQNASTYSALSTTSQIFYTGTGTGEDNSIQTDFEVGVSVDENVPSGDYSTEIEVLAAVKE